MNKFTQLLIIVSFLLNIHLSISQNNKIDTTHRFNEVTDIELRIKELLEIDTVKVSADSETYPKDTVHVIKDTIQTVVQDSIKRPILQDSIIAPISAEPIEIPARADSVRADIAIEFPKWKPIFTPPIIKTSLDTLYTRKSNGTIQLPEQEKAVEDSYAQVLSFRDTMLYNPLFLPVVFTGRIESPDSAFVYPQHEEDRLQGILITSDNTFSHLIEEQNFIDKVRREYFLNNKERIKMSKSELKSIKQTATDTDVREKFNPFKELLTTQTSFSLERPDVEGIKIGRVYWSKTGNHSLHVSQNYLSPNWYRGGTSNYNINSNQLINLNYHKDKIRFNNRFEWRLSVYSADNDSLRDFRIANDMIRYYGDFGLTAFKKWSYSTNLDVKTQVFNSYQANRDVVLSSFLAPLYVNAGVGMKYNLNKPSKSVRHRRIRIDVSISPISINYRYVGNEDVNERRYGIPAGKKSLFDKGSSLNANLTYNISRYTTWTSRFKYFTNYSKAEAELENTLDMSLSQYLSTRLYLNLRYDDGVPSHEDYKYLQINEVISFGLNYKW